MTAKELLEMPLHSSKYLEGWWILRVSNGWIYIFGNSSCFVPEPQKEDVVCVSEPDIEFDKSAIEGFWI